VIAVAAGAGVSPAVALVGLGAVTALWVWQRPNGALEIAAFLVLAIRPSLDVFGERRFGLGPFASNPAVVLGLVVLWLGGLLVLRRGSIGAPIWPDRSARTAHLLLVCAYGIAVVSGTRLYGSVGAAEGIREFFRVVSVLAGFLTVWWWASTTLAYKRAWGYLVGGAIVPIGVSLWQLQSGGGFSDIAGMYRIQGTFSHPNAYSQYLVPFVLVAVAGLANRRGAIRLLLGALAAALTLLIALSYTRTAIVALVVGLIVVPLLQTHRLGFGAMMRAIGIVGTFALVGWLIAGNLIRERFSTLSLGRAAIEAAQAGESENSFEWRLVNWSVLVQLGMEHPIGGHGAGMTTILNPLVSAGNGLPFNAHDDFVRFFFEGGVIGVVLYGLYAVMLCRWAVQRARSVGGDHAATAFAVAGSFLALFLLTGGTTELSLQTADLYQLYGMLGVVAAVPLRRAGARR